MAIIEPFRGILYRQTAVKDLAAVMAPPYDVISEESITKYYTRHELNIIRLILGKGISSNRINQNSYQNAAGYFQNWLRDGILGQDTDPAVYIYSQTYSVAGGGAKERMGYIARLKLEDFESGVVLPHEYTFEQPRLDRLNLLRACRANFDPIFCTYSDPQMKIDRLLEDLTSGVDETIRLEDEEGIVNKLWRVGNREAINFIRRQMTDKQIVLADGHHRYEAGLAYRDEIRESIGQGSGAEFMMVYFVNLFAPGLSVLPYHRTISELPGLNALTLNQILSARFKLEGIKPFPDESKERTLKRLLSQNMAESESEGNVFGLLGRECGFWMLKNESDKQAQEDLPIVEHLMEELDVSILHRKVIAPLLSECVQKDGEGDLISYTPDPYEALRMLEKGESDIAFFLNSTRIDEIMAIARAGGRMPQKSTYFYPKPITGMVINKLDK